MNTVVWGALGVHLDTTVCGLLCMSPYLHLTKDVGVYVRQICLSGLLVGPDLQLLVAEGGEEVTRCRSDSTCPWSVYVIVCISDNVVSDACKSSLLQPPSTALSKATGRPPRWLSHAPSHHHLEYCSRSTSVINYGC